MLKNLKDSLNGLFSLFFPKLCLGCNGEIFIEKNFLCYSCEIDLPVTYFHFFNDTPMRNQVLSHPRVANSFSLYYFQSNGIMEKLLYDLKYGGHKKIGVFFGRKLAAALAVKPIKYKGIIGVPLHKKRKWKRGFNQVDVIGRTATKLLGVPYYSDLLIRTKNTPPLSKSKGEREVILSHAFEVKKTLPKGGHFLLIDDIFTTGATLNACSKVLLDSALISLSIATIAYRN